MVTLVRRISCTLDAQERAEFATLIGTVAWDGNDARPVLGALSEPPTAQANRRPQQEFTSFLELGTKGDWAAIDAASKPLGTLSAIQSLIARLGGRCLDGNSLKLGNTLWMMVCDPDIDDKDYIHKQSMLAVFEREFKKVTDKMQDPPEYIEKLPGTPAELLNEFPGVYAMQFGAAVLGGGAVHMRCPYSIESLMELDSSYRCKGAGTEALEGSQRSVVQIGSDPMDSHRETNMFCLSLSLKPECSPYDCKFQIQFAKGRNCIHWTHTSLSGRALAIFTYNLLSGPIGRFSDKPLT